MICKRLLIGIALFVAASASQLQASFLVNFDDVATDVYVDSFYNGGTSSDLLSGPNLGVDFQPGDWITTTGYGETSAPNLAFTISGLGFVNVAAGFTGSFSFTYGVFSDSTITLWDGLGGSGTILGSYFALTNDVYNFDFATIVFSGNAKSVSIASGQEQFGWDDLKFGTGNVVPEPASICLWGIGVLGAGIVSRKRLSRPKC